MIKFDIITIFPEIFDSYFKESLIKRALDKRLIKINIHNLRKWTKDKHHTVDDKPFGGGLGMVMKVEPIYRAVKELSSLKKELSSSRVILFSPGAKKFNQKMAYKFSKLDHLILICGRYEGVDERVAKYIADEEISIGDYVLMGGEIPAMIVVEAVSRLVPGIVGKTQFLKERVTEGKGFVEYPQYTRPEIFNKWPVPKILMSGNHKKIEEWRKEHQKTIE
ncbi:MAG: tRNA (guanosine(37)-N1)-methyltransferase TrmD [Candidatus Nealsonbacteria bacterium]|nr:tRNA (guanosine(37)-N1)-methyltransferase TrmD [Candidatus Nealsonbacteria bacterium]